MTNDSDWVAFTDTYIASGKEEYITIGNFKNDNKTPVKDSATPPPWYIGNNNDQGVAYYYIDDISVIPTRPILTSTDTIIERGSQVRLSPVTDTISSYQWSPSTGLDDPTAAGPWASPDETTTYTVTKMTHCDTTTAKVKVKVVESLDQPLFIPNIFSPNGTGDPENEKFKVYGDVTFKDYHLMIYNRWGQKVFESTDPKEAWKGEGVEQGVFVYHLSGVLGNGEKVERKGNVTLLE